ncbi:MAG TPA: helix-turn-helix domain-containing protein [Solirubrobacteraceae bacterium]|nr:helix-turn-helix domain-containing protein [Solirubrobacteraceae bacterium]
MSPASTTIASRHETEALCRYALHISATLADAARRGDSEAIRATLGRLPDDAQPEPIVGAVEHAARTFGVTVADIHSPSRRREKVDARAVACYAARLLGYSYVAIGRHVDRDHSTVMHAVSRVGETPRLRGIAERIAGPLGWDREAEAS